MVVPAPFTPCASVPVLPLKFVSPEYVPLRLCVPSASVEEEQVPVPLVSVAVQTAALPLLVSTIGTMPVGVPAPGATALTVTVKVTDCPKAEGFGLDEMEVVVPAWFTTCPPLKEPELPA